MWEIRFDIKFLNFDEIFMIFGLLESIFTHKACRKDNHIWRFWSTLYLMQNQEAIFLTLPTSARENVT